MNLGDLLTDLYRRLKYQATPATTVTDQLTAFLNETQREIVSEPGMEVLLYDALTFASVGSTPTYSLPPAVARIRQVYDTTNLIVLQPRSLGWYRSAYPSPTITTGIPDSYVELGYRAVSVQPSDASAVFVSSTSASDGTDRTAYVEGYITGGYFRSASCTMNGVTAVQVDSVSNWIEITKFSIAANGGAPVTAAGAISLYEDSGSGTELARIPIGQTQSTYRTIALAVCPASAVTYSVDFERDITDMVNLTDQPLLPERFHRLLGVGARMRSYEGGDDRRYQIAQAEYLYGLKKLKSYVYSQAVGSPNLRSAQQPVRASRLGAWYAVDRW